MRWTNGLPGAPMRLRSMMAHRSLSASKPWMRADIHYGPERDEAPLQWSDTLMQRLTFDQLNYVTCDTRPDHTKLILVPVLLIGRSCCLIASGRHASTDGHGRFVFSCGHSVASPQVLLCRPWRVTGVPSWTPWRTQNLRVSIRPSH